MMAQQLSAEAPLAQVPGAAQTGQKLVGDGRFTLPVGVYDGSSVPLKSYRGGRLQRGWTLPDRLVDGTLQVFEDLARQVEARGFRTRLRCSTRDCGGFDFRRALELLPPPMMFVDLAEFHALTAERDGEAGAEALSLMVSRTATTVTWQSTLISPGLEAPAVRPVARIPEISPPPPDLPEGPAVARASMQDKPELIAELLNQGAVVLEDVRFEPGSSRLVRPVPASLDQLARYLNDTPEARILIVGHSDGRGSAEANMSLSRKRAMSVRQALVEGKAVPGDRVGYDGVGALAPRDTNATEEGRARNRRVEVVLQSD